MWYGLLWCGLDVYFAVCFGDVFCEGLWFGVYVCYVWWHIQSARVGQVMWLI